MWHSNDAWNFEISWQNRRGTDWQSEHKKPVQLHVSEHGTVSLFDEMQALLWPSDPENTPAPCASTPRSSANRLASGLARSATIPLPEVLGSRSLEHPIQTTEFCADLLKVPRPPIWRSSLKKLP